MSEERAHARLSPSGAKRWLACAGQPALSDGLSSVSSAEAERGTLAHKVLELCLANGFDAKDFVGNAARQTSDFTQDDADAVQVAVDWLLSEFDETKGDEVDLEIGLRYCEENWGTADVVRYRVADRELLIADYKHGSGVPVEATNNPQGINYALMKLKALGNRGVSRVRFVIIQPRCYHDEGPIREYVVDGVDMLDWEDIFVEGIAKASQATADRPTMAPDEWAARYLVTGDHCSWWCPAAAICPALKARAVEALQNDFADGPPYNVEALADSLARVKQVKAWATAVDEFAYAEAERGVKIPGFKLVAKKAMARWREPDEVLSTMEMLGVDRGQCFEPAELKSPAQLRATIEPTMAGKTKKARTEAAKTLLDGLTAYVSSGHTLVPLSDPRAAIRSDAADDFTAVE